MSDMWQQTGAGTYRCTIEFTDQTRAGYTITVDACGSWVANP